MRFLALIFVAALLPPALADYRSAAETILAGKDDGACSEFRDMIDRSPAYDYGHFMLGLCAIHAGDAEGAVEHLRTAVDLNDLRFDYRYKLARALTMTGQFEETLETLEAAARLVTDDTRLAFHTSRGFALSALKHWTDAATDLETANSLDGDRPALLNQLAICYVGLERYDEAVALLDDSLAVNSASAATHRLLAETLLRKARRDPASAVETYAQAMPAALAYRALVEDDPTADDLVARAALGAGQYPAAAEAFERFLSHRPSHCPAWINLALSRIGMERWDQAAQSLETALECDPDSVDSLEMLAMVYRLQQRLEESLATYERANSLRPSPAIEEAIAQVRHNIEVVEMNAGADRQDRRDRELQDQYDADYDDLQDKVRRWKKRTGRD